MTNIHSNIVIENVQQKPELLAEITKNGYLPIYQQLMGRILND